MCKLLFFSSLVVGTMTTWVAAASAPVIIDSNAIQSTIAVRMPAIQIVDIKPAPIPELYEVYTGKAIYYTDRSGHYLLQGKLIDTQTQKDLTATRVDERNRIDFNSLPFDRAIKIVKGNGKRKFAVFTDPDCPYCRKFEEQLKYISDVTMYVFLFPLKVHPNAEQHSKDIWCSDDKANAWTAYLQENKEPARSTCTSDPVSETLALGRKLNVSGTPTVYFATGERKTGGMNADDIRARLAAAASGAGS